MVTLRIITGDEPSNPQHITKEYLEKYGSGKIFVETGTYMGETVNMALEFGYDMIHSVELNDGLYNRAVEMFADNPKVKIWHGDSAEKLQEIVNEIGDQPATFWLDAHASGPLTGGKSGGSPVVDELKIIKSSPCKEHTIFIDDKRLFGCAEWSFVKEEDAMNEIKNINENYKIVYLDGQIKNDVICATLKG